MTTGTTKRVPGRALAISRAAPNRRGATYWISERRLPGSTAIRVSPSPTLSAARASARGGSIGISLAIGWPT